MTAAAAYGRHMMALFVDPPRGFRLDAAKWLPPLLILMSLTMFIVALHERIVPFEDRVDAQIAQAEAILGHPLSAAEREARFADQPSPARVAAHLAFYGASTAAVLLFTAFIFTTLAALCGSDARYPTVLAVVADAMVPPSVVWTACATTMLLLKPAADLDAVRVDALVLSSVGAFLDRDAWSPFVLSLFSSIDLFSIWTAALTAVGLGLGAPQLGRRAAVTVTILVWATYALLKAVIALWIPQLA
jgi:hypothetical protein